MPTQPGLFRQLYDLISRVTEEYEGLSPEAKRLLTKNGFGKGKINSLIKIRGSMSGVLGPEVTEYDAVPMRKFINPKQLDIFE